MKYNVVLSRTISVTVEVEADSPEAAKDIVDRANYGLPPRDEWQGHKDWRCVVYDAAGNEVWDEER